MHRSDSDYRMMDGCFHFIWIIRGLVDMLDMYAVANLNLADGNICRGCLSSTGWRWLRIPHNKTCQVVISPAMSWIDNKQTIKKDFHFYPKGIGQSNVNWFAWRICLLCSWVVTRPIVRKSDVNELLLWTLLSWSTVRFVSNLLSRSKTKLAQ